MNDRSILEVDGLSVSFGGVAALIDVSFTVEEGEVVGLIGPNGAGKTTCIDALSGFNPNHTGRVRFRGRDLSGDGPHVRSGLGFVRTFQSLDLFDDLTVYENLLAGASVPDWRSTVADAVSRRSALEPAVDDALEVLDLAEWAEARPAELSNGQRHLVALARSLVARPALVLLDEPAAGLDPAESRAMGRLLASLPGRGTSVLLVEHDMSLVMSVCDRIHVLDLGQLISSGSPSHVRSDPAVIEAYLGTKR